MPGSLVTAATLVFVLCFFFAPRWETVDDVGMSMVAHGYGVSAISVPNLIFSNVLWGYLVRAIPEIRGVLGYSIATLGVLVIVGAVVIHGLCRLGAGYVVCLSVLALVLVRPVLFPQFTVNAGLLLVGAIVCWHVYAQQRDKRALVAGCLLAFFSYLVRFEEFLLVLLVALPLLPWRALLNGRAGRIASLALISAIAASTVIDHQAYAGPEWRAFNALEPGRAPITDYGADEHLKNRPDILQRHGYSANDIDLIRRRFYVDPEIANPDALNAMLDELGPMYAQQNAVAKGWVGVKAFSHPSLLPLVVTALILAVLRPGWQLTASWGLCISGMFLIGVLGRPEQLRIYVPLVCLLLIAPLLGGRVSGWRSLLGAGVLTVGALVNASIVFPESRIAQTEAERVRQGLAAFPSVPVVAWGAEFPYKEVYPVLGASSAAMSYRLYSLGVSTLAPSSVAFAEKKMGRGMIDLLVKDEGVPIIADELRFGYLETYCREHLHRRLEELSAQKYGSIVVSRRRCVVSR